MKTRGAVTLVFDDGYRAVYEQILPLLRDYNVRAVFAVPLSTAPIANQEVASPEEWLAAATHDGHEIVAHGIGHTDLTTLSNTALERELSEPAEILRTSTLIYPGGAHDDRVIDAAQKHYKAARTVLYGLNDMKPKDPMRLRTINFSKRNFSVLRANIHALRVYIHNKWLIETYHMVNQKPSDLLHSVVLEDLRAHLDFLTSIPVKITTIEEMI